MRILAIWSTLFCLGATLLQAQPTTAFLSDPIPDGYWLEAQPWVTHDGIVGSTDLTGHTTYRLVLHTDVPEAFVSSLGGDASNPFMLHSSASPAWFNFSLGVNLGSDASAILANFFPEYAFDSWLTIGATQEVSNYSISAATGAINPFTAFNAGENVTVDDEIGFALFNLYPGSVQAGHPGFAGDDLSIVLGQITTTGTLSGQFYVQIFPDGTQSSDLRCLFPILDSNPYAIEGCTDPMACNFDEAATDDDGSCTYPASNYVDCAGACLADADSDGVCDAFEINGCQDVSACNFDPEATDPGACTFAEPGFDCAGNTLGQDGYWIQAEPIAVHNGEVGTVDLTGHTTYQLVLHTPNPEVFVSALGGDVSNPFELYSDQSPAWFNETTTGWNLGTDVNPALFPFLPAAAYDSWLTIGATQTTEGYDVSLAVGEINPFTSFNAGENVVVDDEIGFAVFTTYPGEVDLTHPAFAGDDLALVLGQITTQGTLSGWIYLQLFPNGDQSEEIRQRFPILNSAPYGTPGCTDFEACNYDSSASTDDGSCSYPDSGYDCDGNCIADADNDGICDEFEVAGCTNAFACNYDEAATDEDGSCFIPEPGFDCEGNDLMVGLPEGYWLEAQPYAQPEGIMDGIDFTGATTYRLVLHSPTQTAYVSALGGDQNNPFELYSTSTPAWINHPLGVDVGSEYNPNLASIAPGTLYDSWLTIGATEQTEGYLLNSAVGLINPFGNFNNGLNTVVDDELGFAVFTTYPGALDLNHPAFAGDDYAITLGQITTTGVLSGWIYVQIFPEGTQTIDWRYRFPILNSNPYEGAGCTDSIACNFDPNATTDNGTCTYAEAGYDCDGNCINDSDMDGVCDEFEAIGCQDNTACNFDPMATDAGDCTYAEDGYDCDGNCINDADMDGVCDEFEIVGCQDNTACNYDFTATDAGDCTYAEEGYDCDGNCINDADMDGVCDEFEVVGCQDNTACNYDATATDAGDCTYAEAGYDCDGNCINDSDMDGVCDEFEIAGCQDGEACNYNVDATDEDGSCTYAEAGYDCDGNCINDADMDGVCDEFEIVGCQDNTACNYDATATDAGDCTYAEAGYDCDGNCINDTDTDGVCDEFEIVGCQDNTACNYDATATDAGDCTYAEAGYDCDGNCINDSDMDGVCDEFEIAGCQDGEACNYNVDATDEDGSCTYAEAGYDCDGNCINDADMDGVCDEFEIAGCQDGEACNYNANATDAGDCTYAKAGYDCDGNCINDADMDGVCDEFEIIGCQDSTACNYDATATDAGDCTYAEAGYDCDGNCINDADMDGVCDEFEVVGCQDSTACNYDATATDAGDCTYAEEGYDCDGNCINDADMDGVCDEFEIVGCQDSTACNYDATATDAGDCTYAEEGYDCDGNCINDADMDGVCDEFEAAGCTDEGACNYDDVAEIDNGSCEYVTCAGCAIQQACNYDPEATINDIASCQFVTAVYLDCDGNCINDADGDGICDENEPPVIFGCTDINALNYSPIANTDDGSCVAEVPGCNIPSACNYDVNATTYDGSCDFYSCIGCTNMNACNYNPDATVSANSTCTFPASSIVDCDGACNNDADGDGVCDELEIYGCTDSSANNYNQYATEDNGNCLYLTGGCVLPFACNYDPSADYLVFSMCDLNFPCASGLAPQGPEMAAMNPICNQPGACNYLEEGECVFTMECIEAVTGCMDPSACDYNAESIFPALCDYVSCLGCTDASACNYDETATGSNGSCEYVSCAGCTDVEAANYDELASIDDGSCQFPGCVIPGACNFNPDANVSDDSCDFESCIGCTNASACNYDPAALYNSGCEYTSCVGCSDENADNFDAGATIDDGSCIYSGCTIPAACNYDSSANTNDGSCDFTSCVGCGDSSACNYDPSATISDALQCEYPYVGFDCSGECLDEDGNGVCDYIDAIQVDGSGFCGEGTVWDEATQTCVAVNTCPGDFNNDGLIQLEDLLDFLFIYGTSCE